MRKLGVLAVLTVAVLGCGGAPKRWGAGKDPKKPAAPEPQNIDYSALGEREVSGTYPVHPVNLLNGAFTAQLQATAPPEVKAASNSDGTPEAQMTFRIGSSSPMSCWVRGARSDAGMAIQQKLDDLKKQMDQRGIKGRFDTPDVAVEVEGNHPVLYADVPVTVGSGTAEKKGLIKLAVSPRDGGSLLCMHDEVGYKKTFRRIVGGLVTTANVSGDRPQPVYTEISLAKIEGKTIGYTELYEFAEPTQVRTVKLMTLAAMKKVDGKPTWTVTDAVRSIIATPKGEVTSIKSIAMVNKKPVTSMELKRGSKNDFVYDGTVNGTKVKGSFTAPRALETEGALAARMQQLASGKPKELKYLTYDEEQKVEAMIEVTATREDPKTLNHKADDGRVWTTAIDALGLPERTIYTRDKEGERLILERAYSQGQPSATVAPTTTKRGGGGSATPAQ
jgi:hypothetical protein